MEVRYEYIEEGQSPMYAVYTIPANAYREDMTEGDAESVATSLRMEAIPVRDML